MDGADGERERVGPVLRMAALAATLLALAAVIGPRLASSGGGGSSDGTTAASLPGGAGIALATTTTTTAVATSTTGATTATTTTASGGPVAAAADSGAVDLIVAGVHAGRYGPERTSFGAGETIGWHFRVTNSGAEYLWGVFVYLEQYGEVSCSRRRLDVGESADCWAETTAAGGGSVADARVTAWTDTRMVSDGVSQRVDALGG